LGEYEMTPDEKVAVDEIIKQTPTRTDYKLCEQLAAIIQMLISCPNGLSMLLGRVSPPDSEQINEMILSFSPAGNDLGVRVDGGQNIPQAERLIYTAEAFCAVISACGGWGHIVEAARGYMKVFPNEWAIIMDHTRWVKTKITRMDGSSLKKVADLHGCSVDAVRNAINSFPRELAEAILATPQDGEFNLRPVNGYPAI
jgi:hypothetical protein